MSELANNAELKISGGDYALKVGGAMDLQWQLEDEGFSTVTDGVFTVASDVIVELPACTVKIINAGANILYIRHVSVRPTQID